MKTNFISRIPWREKMARPQEPKIVDIPPKMSRFGTGTMLIPTPQLIDKLIRRVPRGTLVTVSALRRKLAADFGANVTCPLTTGIFIRIAAEAAEEDRTAGARRITPYWRVIKDDGSLNPKFPGGVAQQGRYLRAEGFTTRRKGEKLTLTGGFEQRLHKMR